VEEISGLVSLDARAQRRAYSGTPPVVPHPIDQMSSSSCLLCHAEGLRIGDATAPMIPHEAFSSCTQCHAEGARKSPGLLSPSAFVGEPEPTHGDRAWQGAPPVIPHSTLMRSTCLSCHGPSGRPGMRTSHPQRNNCIQCHARSAQLNQIPTFDAQAFIARFRESR